MKIVAPAKRLHEAFYAMGITAHIPGGPHHIYFPFKEPAARDYFKEISDLSTRMPWIRSVNRGLPPLMQYGLDLRPYPGKQEGRSMLAKMMYYCGLYEFDPWFDRMEATGQHVVISRTLSQQNTLFPWEELLTKLKRYPLIFVGTAEEYEAFKPRIPAEVSVEHREPKWGGSGLDLCLSAMLYIGNHSPALAIVEGAHVPAITEVSLSNPDNVYTRPGSSPCFTHRAVFPDGVPDLAGSDVQASVRDLLLASYADWMPPPKGWRVDCEGRAPRYFESIDEAAFYLCKYTKDLRMTHRQYARRLVLEQNLRHYPEWADEAVAHRLFRKPTLALRAASRKIKLRKFLPHISSYLSDLCD